ELYFDRFYVFDTESGDSVYDFKTRVSAIILPKTPDQGAAKLVLSPDRKSLALYSMYKPHYDNEIQVKIMKYKTPTSEVNFLSRLFEVAKADIAFKHRRAGYEPGLILSATGDKLVYYGGHSVYIKSLDDRGAVVSSMEIRTTRKDYDSIQNLGFLDDSRLFVGNLNSAKVFSLR